MNIKVKRWYNWKCLVHSLFRIMDRRKYYYTLFSSFGSKIALGVDHEPFGFNRIMFKRQNK